MKNIKRLLTVTVALISASSIATLVQPLVPVGEDSPVRISVGAKGGLAGSHQKEGFGMSNVGGALSFAHNVGYDFEYGLGLGYDYTSPVGRIWTDKSKAMSGSRIDVDLIARYMPELAERFHLGLNFGLGWGQQFGKNMEEANKVRKFGDLNVKVGPALSWGFSDMASFYAAANYSLHNIQIGIEEGNERAKAHANLSGVDLPLGLWFQVADNTGLFIEANSRLQTFNKDLVWKSFKEEITLGMSFAI